MIGPVRARTLRLWTMDSIRSSEFPGCVLELAGIASKFGSTLCCFCMLFPMVLSTNTVGLATLQHNFNAIGYTAAKHCVEVYVGDTPAGTLDGSEASCARNLGS